MQYRKSSSSMASVCMAKDKLAYALSNAIIFVILSIGGNGWAECQMDILGIGLNP